MVGNTKRRQAVGKKIAAAGVVEKKLAAGGGVGSKNIGASGKNGVSGVLGFSSACVRRPHAELKRRTRRGHRTVVANISIWIADSNAGASPDRARGPGPTHEETLPWAWTVPRPWPFRVPGLRVHSGWENKYKFGKARKQIGITIGKGGNNK